MRNVTRIASPAQYDTLSAAEAMEVQRSLQEKVRLEPLTEAPCFIGGADISFNKYSETVYAGIIVLSFPDLRIVERTSVIATAKFPYIPGLLSFREAPAVLQAWNQLRTKPNLLVLDGHGIAHPRRLGIASHIGVLLDIPAIGCGKTVLTGTYENLGEAPGDIAPLFHRGEVVGYALRTKAKCNPVFVSPGHRITLRHAVEMIKRCSGKYRIPEPTRQAHEWVNEVRIAAGENANTAAD